MFLFAYLDWKALATCQDSKTCRDHLQDYLIEKVGESIALSMDIGSFIRFIRLLNLLCTLALTDIFVNHFKLRFFK